MKCLVFGGNGFIGSHLVNLLLAEGHSVGIYDHSKRPYGEIPSQATWIKGELGQRSSVQAALSDVEVVFHLIHSAVANLYGVDSVHDVWPNVVHTHQLLEECVNSGVRRVVFASSGGSVYGVPQKTPISETHPLNPISSYGITKMIIEKYLGVFKRLHGLDYAVLRLANAYGEGQKLFGSQGVVGVFLGGMLKGVPLEVYGDGSAVRDFVYVKDLVEAFYQAGVRKGLEEGIFNVGSGKGVSVKQVLKLLSDVAGPAVEVRYGPAREVDVSINILDSSLIKDRLGWTPTTDLNKGLGLTYAWARKMRD